MARSDSEALTRTIRTRQIEAIALGVLALLPVVPHLTFILRTGVPRFSLAGDLALLEQATRHVWRGDTLLGPLSRFEWHHPGPLYFYLSAPFEALFGPSSTGLFVGACAINAAAAGGLVYCTRIFARRAHAIAALMVVLAWFLAFGNVAANPWNPLVVVLPLMAFLVNAAMVARGRSGALYPGAVFGALAMQTHVAAASTVVVAGIIAVVAFTVGARRRAARSASDWLYRHDMWRLLITGALLLVMFVPPLVEQLTAQSGNLAKLYTFFVDREAPLKPLSEAMMHWTTATAWMPERIIARTVVDEGAVPQMVRPVAMPNGVTPNARLVGIIHVAAVASAAIIAARRRDIASLSLLAIGAVANAIAVSALQAVVGVSYHYLVFWTTAATSVAWTGVLGSVFSGIGAIALRLPKLSGVVAPALIILGLTAAVTTASLQRFWLAKHPVAPSSRPELRADLRATVVTLRARSARDESTIVVHRSGATDIADAVTLELEKDGDDVRVATADHGTFVGVRTPTGVSKPLHIYFATTAQPLKTAACLELIGKSGEISVYGSPVETTVCPDPNKP